MSRTQPTRTTRRTQSGGSSGHLLSTWRRGRDDAELETEEINSDNPHFCFGKELHRKYLGFGTIVTAFFAKNSINEDLVQAVNEETSNTSLNRLKTVVEIHKRGNTPQFRLMSMAATKTMSKFPDLRDDFSRLDGGDNRALKDVTSKLRQISKGMKAARQADTCTLKGSILALAQDHARRLGHTLNTALRKEQRGLNNIGTACLFLPHHHLDEYIADPKRFRSEVERGNLKIEADQWPAFLYDETQYNPKKEWTGLFLGETFVRACICILVSPSAARDWPYGTPSSRTYTASNKKGNASLNNITEITPEVVAGIVCQATFALSEVTSWKDKIGDIDLIELYINTVEMLRLDFPWTDKTLDTLQSWILGEQDHEEPVDRNEVFNKRFDNIKNLMAASEGRNINRSDSEDDSPTRRQPSTTQSIQQEPSRHMSASKGQPSVRPSAQPVLTTSKSKTPGTSKRIHRRPSTPPGDSDHNPFLDEEDGQEPKTPFYSEITKFTNGSRAVKPASHARRSSNGSIDSAIALRTSPPSIPLGTQDPAPRREMGQRLRQRMSAGVSAVTNASANTSRDLDSGLHNTQGPVSPACSTQQTPATQSRIKKVKTSSRMPPPTVPAKRTEPTQDDQLFEGSSLTEPETEDSPPRKQRKATTKTKTAPPTSSRKSQRTAS